MIAISFRLPAYCYHARPWGRHVNDGAVEWPPSPWRILRALVATWKRTLPDVPESEVRPILEKLAAPPRFVLPPASTGHTRHYMPWFKKDPDDRTLVFDTFVALRRDARLLVCWSDATLAETQRHLLADILRNLNTLDRSESWCQAELLGDDEAARLQETLYAPISKSISTGQWERIVLLPSQDTLQHARELKKRHPRHDVHIRPLPARVSENEADACYGHF